MIKSNKGITLTSLIIYIIVLTLVVGLLVSITTFFTNNVSRLSTTGGNAAQINKLNMYLIEDVKKDGISILSCTDDNVVFSDGTTYTYRGTDLYRNQVKILTGVEYLFFEENSVSTKQVLRVDMAIKGSYKYIKQMEYVLKYY